MFWDFIYFQKFLSKLITFLLWSTLQNNETAPLSGTHTRNTTVRKCSINLHKVRQEQKNLKLFRYDEESG